MKESHIAIAVLLIIIAIGFTIRLDGAAEPMWLDECHTAWCVDTDSLQVVADRAADGNQPPLYFGLVWAITQGLGISLFSLRLVSLLSGLGLLVVAPLFAKSITNRWSAAALVAALLAFDGQFIFYAGEARSYALVQFLGLLQGIVFASLLRAFYGDRKSSKRLVAWAILSILLLYCHYTSLWIVAAETFVMLVVWVQQKRCPIGYGVALLTVALSLIPRFWNVSMVFARRSNWGSVSSLDQWWIDVEPWLVHWLLIPAALALAAWLLRVANADRVEEAADTAIEVVPSWLLKTWLLAWATIGMFGIAAVDAMEIAPMALLRYSAVCWVGMALFAGCCLKDYRPLVSWLVAAVIFGSSLYGNWWAQELNAYDYRQLPTFRNEDWVGSVSQIGDSAAPVFQLADVIEDIDALTSSDERFQRYLEFPIRGAAVIAEGELFGGDRSLFVIPTWNVQFTSEHLDAIREAGACWFVVRGEFDYAKLVPGELERFLDDPIEFKFIPNERMLSDEVHLIRVRFKPSNDVDAQE